MREVVIGLLWHSVNSGNLGVGALTVGNIALARQACRAVGLKPRFKVLGFLDRDTPIYVSGDDIEVVPLNGKAMLPGGAYGQALKEVDAILDIGGGDSFADIYGMRRFVFVGGSKLVAILRGVPLLLSPQTIGPFSRQPQTALAAWAMNRAQLVIARDPTSLEVARRMSPRARMLQAVDVAFALPFEQRPRGASGKIEVGVNASGLLFNGGYTGGNEFGMHVDYARYTRALIAALVARPNVAVKLISHVNAPHMPSDDDGAVADRLAAEFPGTERAPSFTSPSEAKSYISGLEFLVAGRMHACIAAFSSGVPVVPVAYSRKFAGLFEGVLKYPHLVPVTGLDTDAAVAFTLDAFDRRDRLAEDLRRGTADVEGLIQGYRDELAKFLLAAVARRRP